MLSDDTKEEIIRDIDGWTEKNGIGEALHEISTRSDYKNPDRDPDIQAAIIHFFLHHLESKKGKETVREVFYYTEGNDESNLLCNACTKGKLSSQVLRVFFDTMKRIGGTEFLLEQLKNEPRATKLQGEEEGEQNTKPTGPILTCILFGFREKESIVDHVKVVLEYSFEAGGNEFVEKQLRYELKDKEIFSSLDLFLLVRVKAFANWREELVKSADATTLKLLLDAARRVDGARENGSALLRYLCTGLLNKRYLPRADDKLPPRAITEQLCFALADAGIFRSEFTSQLWEYGFDRDFPSSVEYYEHRQQQGTCPTDGIIIYEEKENEEQVEVALSEDEKRKVLSSYGEDFLDPNNSFDDLYWKLLRRVPPTSAGVVDFLLTELEKVHSNSFMKYLLIRIFSSHDRIFSSHSKWASTSDGRKTLELLPSMLRRFLASAKRIGGDDFLLDILCARDSKPTADPPLKVLFNSQQQNQQAFAHELIEIFLTTAVSACKGDREKLVAVLESLVIENKLFSSFCTELKKELFPLFWWFVEFIRRFGGDELSKKCFEGTLEWALNEKRPFPHFFACSLADIDIQFFRSELRRVFKKYSSLSGKSEINESILYSPEYAEYKEKRRLQARAPTMTRTAQNDNKNKKPGQISSNNSNYINIDGAAAIKRTGLKKFFDFFDLERNGLLDKTAMCAAITQSFPLCGAAEIEKTVRGVEAKSDNGGKLDFDQFCSIVEKIIV